MENLFSDDLIVLQPHHKDLILDFERKFLGNLDTIEAQMKTWDARWRPEALDHFLKLGWSFGRLQSHGETKFLDAYVLAQPLLFFKGWTQTLWIEHALFENSNGAQAMVETVYRWARDKHFQALAFEKEGVVSKIFAESPFPVQESAGILYVKTSKMK